jgi:hypothetical protein
MAKKKFDAVVTVGEYVNNNGEKKKRYLNIGTVMESENGPFLLLDAHILSMQVFALCNKERRDSVLVSLFDPDRKSNSASPEQMLNEDVPF